MSDDLDGFDPDYAAATALGDLADAGPDDLQEPSADDRDDDDQEDSDDGSSTTATGLVATLVLPLFVAPERGPTADTWERYGVGESTALVLDGVTDWLLDLVDLDVEDSLGPAGKIGLGLYRVGADGDGDGGDGSPAADPGGVPSV